MITALAIALSYLTGIFVGYCIFKAPAKPQRRAYPFPPLPLPPNPHKNK